ncbi:hypothetical protein, partial [Streptomyces caniscabiei]|uniref:hypothetical protein n=1 Tax=Streptomyces caniscabiei TaxID=2746961 RepID=UPI001F334777
PAVPALTAFTTFRTAAEPCGPAGREPAAGTASHSTSITVLCLPLNGAAPLVAERHLRDVR